jgi:addiction module HigA family antidote
MAARLKVTQTKSAIGYKANQADSLRTLGLKRIGDIVAGKRSITADTDLRLCRYFGLSDGWWLRGQSNYDMAVAREKMGEALTKIQRCTLLAA